MNNLEIERKWLVKGWPFNLECLYSEKMRQGYIATNPTVRIREETLNDTKYILCFKSHGKLARKEIEINISKEQFNELETLIGLPLIVKTRKTYLLSDGHHLEVNLVDENTENEFYYAEVEFSSEEEALKFKPSDVNLNEYLNEEVTYQKGQSMAAYWIKTRQKSN